LVKGIGMMNDH